MTFTARLSNGESLTAAKLYDAEQLARATGLAAEVWCSCHPGYPRPISRIHAVDNVDDSD